MLAVAVTDAKSKPEKTPKPEKPDQPNLTTECIVFTGDLVGSQAVEGCCPNAGPFPAYTMSFPKGLSHIIQPEETYDGLIFMNYYGAGQNRKFIVQFGTDEFGFEVIGGVIDRDRKSKVLTVTFEDETATDFDNNFLATVSFVLVRTSDLSYCE
jgi:hypothetical protein